MCTPLKMHVEGAVVEKEVVHWGGGWGVHLELC